MIRDTARRLVTSKQTALSTVRLQPSSFARPGSQTVARTNAREMRVTVTFPTANVSKAVYHGLGFPPSGITVLGQNAAGTIYNDFPLNATSRVLVLKCSAANVTADILVR